MRPSLAVTLHIFEKYQQLHHRHAPAFIRHVLDSFREHTQSAAQAAEQLGLSPSRLYALATAWTPGASGGDHAAPWPQPVLDLLKKRLACSPPCPYSFAAAEVRRLHDFKLDRAQVRRWALANKLAHAVPPKKVLAAVRRWQRAQIGELWQLDASPHRWFAHSKLSFPMLNLLDDCSRLFIGAKIYERELLHSYFDFLPAAFLAHGRPLQIYVAYHSIFFTNDPDALTQLGWALKFYDVSFRYAPHPRPKAKLNAPTNTGRAVCPPTSPARRAPKSKRPIRRSTPCGRIATPGKSIANGARPRNGPGPRPKKKNAPACGPRPGARGGIMSGASER